MEFDFNSMINAMMMAEMRKIDPKTARVMQVLLKRGFSFQDAMAFLMELAAAIQEEQDTDEN